MVDTRRDPCLVSGSALPLKSSDVQIFEKDLYLHRNHDRSQQYYFHIRPVGKFGKDKVVPVSAVMAERYLMQRGLTCSTFPQNEAVSRLYAWGYGIAEEF